MNGITEFIHITRNMLKIDSLFPTPVAKFSEPILAGNLLPVAKEILEDQKNLTNPWGYKCTYGTRIEDNPKLDYFKKWAYNKADIFFEQLGYDYKKINFNIEIFISELFEGEYHVRHTHPNSKLSGILYLETPPGSAPLRIHDPRPFRDFVNFPRLHNIDNDFIDLEVGKGIGYLWPAWLGHEVVVNRTGDNGRIAIVFNM